MAERLDKFLVSQGIGSRKEVGKLVRRGAVTVNEAQMKDPGGKILPERDSVCVEGEKVLYQKNLYIMMNKPKGVLSATEDRKGKTVLDLLPEAYFRRGLFPAGRLDKDTTGLLIITDDGDFAHRMLAPKSHVYKLYEVLPEKPIEQEEITAFENGLECGGQIFAPARLWTEEKAGERMAYVEIREGKFHQVKRMFEAVGNQVLELKRLRIGGLWLDASLQEGACRLLDTTEISAIFR